MFRKIFLALMLILIASAGCNRQTGEEIRAENHAEDVKRLNASFAFYSPRDLGQQQKVNDIWKALEGLATGEYTSEELHTSKAQLLAWYTTESMYALGQSNKALIQDEFQLRTRQRELADKCEAHLYRGFDEVREKLMNRCDQVRANLNYRMALIYYKQLDRFPENPEEANMEHYSPLDLTDRIAELTAQSGVADVAMTIPSPDQLERLRKQAYGRIYGFVLHRLQQGDYPYPKSRDMVAALIGYGLAAGISQEDLPSKAELTRLTRWTFEPQAE